MSERELYGEIMRAFSCGGNRLFRANSGMAWQGVIIEKSPEKIVLAHPRPIHMGASGMSDLIGWSPKVIAPEDIGILCAIYTAVEVKSKTGRPTDEQMNFIELVLRSGGRAGIAKSVEDAKKILQIRY